MSEILNRVIENNRAYAAGFGDKANLPMPPGQKLAILTCMDARLDPAKFAGLVEGDAHVVRNAGGRATEDAVRSLVISYKLLGTNVWMVIHHSDCGMQTFDNDTMSRLLAHSLETARIGTSGWVDTGEGPGSEEGAYINWLPIRDQKASVVADVRRLKNHPLVPSSISIFGYIFDVKTGLLQEVPGATAADLKH